MTTLRAQLKAATERVTSLSNTVSTLQERVSAQDNMVSSAFVASVVIVGAHVVPADGCAPSLCHAVGVDTSDFFDDLRELKDRLRQATSKNAEMVTQVTALRLKNWEQEEQIKAVMLDMEKAQSAQDAIEVELKGEARLCGCV